jgi:hypothetical protein
VGLLVPTIQNQELVAEGQILKNQVATRHERASEGADYRQNQAEHGEISLIIVIFEVGLEDCVQESSAEVDHSVQTSSEL